MSGHLVVEHGLDNSATISFLTAPHRASDLDAMQMRALLAISYNNLVEWHLFVSETDVRRVNNLARSPDSQAADRTDILTGDNFDRYLSATRLQDPRDDQRFSRTLKACDDALLNVVTRWRLLLKADYPAVENTNISALFNAMIFVRGCEDRDLDRSANAGRVLLKTLDGATGDTLNLGSLLEEALKQTGVSGVLSDFVSLDALSPFANVDRATASNLFRDMYAPREAPYDFNFALMSKHALSRIYEKYVALLRPDDGYPESGIRQLSFLAAPAVEAAPRKSGAIYTPQFIAGFFARYIRDNVTPRRLRALRSIDPACGSGIFLRTLLELQCDPSIPGTTTGSIAQAFLRAEGIDKDPNACEATRLSLALLHLVATGALPNRDGLNIRNRDAIAVATEAGLDVGSFGAVITNPPYIKLDHLDAGEREVYRTYLGGGDPGRIDAYVPFVKLCLDLAEPGGFVCLVLPQTFLTASNAQALRRRIADRFDVRCMVDLTAVPVFEGVGAYTILFVLQRRASASEAEGGPAQVARVTEFVGAALQACLDGEDAETPYYSVYKVEQRFFRSRDWVLVSPSKMRVDDRLRTMPRMSTFLHVRQGFVTGADDIFIIEKRNIPSGEEAIYADYLPDKQILRYRLPIEAQRAVFFPYQRDVALDERRLERDFPGTWSYLLRHRDKLETRKSVKSGSVPWWRPERPRDPGTLLRPKIVCPHLMLTPRFAVEAAGSFAVSHGPFMVARDEGEEFALLRFFCAVLNSSVCNWHLRTYSPKYGSGYNRLEVPLLKAVPVPDFNTVEASALAKVVDSVEKLSSGRAEIGLDDEIDDLITGLYGFTTSERRNILGAG